MAHRSDKLVPPVDEPVHARTGAKKTTTPEAPASSSNQAAEISARQKADAERSQRLAAAANGGTSTVPVPADATSQGALDRNLNEISRGLGGLKFSMNGNTGGLAHIDGTEVAPGGEYICPFAQTHRGVIKFNGEGVEPTEIMVGLAEERTPPTREELGDNDPEEWPVGLSGQREDPWRKQWFLPLQSCDASQELLIFVARNATGINAVMRLLDRVGKHPLARRGYLPKVRLEVGSYFNKTFKRDQPVPVFKVVGWVDGDGVPYDPATAPKSPPVPPLSAAQKAELNDEIPFS
jgi:hypothetical protein